MGDAAISMTGMILETTARTGIAIFTILLNDGIMVETPDDFIPALEGGISVTGSCAPFLIDCIVKEGQNLSRY